MLTTNKSVPAFDLAVVNRGDCIRFRRATETTGRNGIITKLGEYEMEVLFSNVQNNATSFYKITAADVSIGVWEIFWTTDFVTINHNPSA